MSNLVKQDLLMLPERMADAAWEVIIQKVSLAKGLAQVFVRVETGSLRDSIRVERGGEGLHYRQIRLRAGGYVVNPKTGRLVDYAAFIEAKYPFLKPAIDDAFNDIKATMDQAIMRKAQPLVRTCFGFQLQPK